MSLGRIREGPLGRKTGRLTGPAMGSEVPGRGQREPDIHQLDGGRKRTPGGLGHVAGLEPAEGDRQSSREVGRSPCGRVLVVGRACRDHLASAAASPRSRLFAWTTRIRGLGAGVRVQARRGGRPRSPGRRRSALMPVRTGRRGFAQARVVRRCPARRPPPGRQKNRKASSATAPDRKSSTAPPPAAREGRKSTRGSVQRTIRCTRRAAAGSRTPANRASPPLFPGPTEIRTRRP